MNKISQILVYLLFGIFAAFALAGLFLLRYQPLAQFFVVVLLATVYFIAGVVFHLAKGDFTRQIILEFGGIAILAVLSFGILTFWRMI